MRVELGTQQQGVQLLFVCKELVLAGFAAGAGLIVAAALARLT